MTFASPLALLLLLLIPLAIGGYLVMQKRRSRYAVRFTNLALLANVVDQSPNWRRHLPPVLSLRAISRVGVTRIISTASSPAGQRAAHPREYATGPSEVNQAAQVLQQLDVPEDEIPSPQAADVQTRSE